MGTTFTVAAYGEHRGRLASAVQAAFDETRRIDRFLSNYRSDSELSRINRRAASGPFGVSTEMADLLARCLAYSRASDGAFDITVGALMKVWGFYKGSGRLPSRSALAHARRRVGYRHVVLDAANKTVRFRQDGLELDPGGIGKGYAVDRMAKILREAGVKSAFVTAGGSSMYAIGVPPKDARGWYVRIRDPQQTEETAAELYLEDESLSTSGSYEKFFEADGKIYTHIMDPRTGMPAEGVAAVSVLAPLTLDSEAWTKAFFVNGRAWSEAHMPSAFRVLLCETDAPCRWVGDDRPEQ
jgi:thiamine biosynthesis lipoprotein